MTPPINSNNILPELSNNYTFECLDKSGIIPDHGICRRSKSSALFLLSHFHLSYSYLTDNSIINYIHTLLSSSSASSVGIA